jgi:type VI secretion system protein ImpL
VGNLAQAASRSGPVSDLRDRYQQDVVQQCRLAIVGRYPFGAATLPDVQIVDFGRVFGHGGMFDSFFRQHLEPLVDTAGSPWRWKTDASGAAVGIPGGALPQFELARQIRDTFFPPGSQMPTLVFNVTFTSAGLDASFNAGRLEVDGSIVEYKHGPEAPKPITWPGDKATGAAFILQPKQGTVEPIAEKGPWALFRLLARGTLNQGPKGSYQLEFLHGGRITKILITPSSLQDPFGRRWEALQRFNCG